MNKKITAIIFSSLFVFSATSAYAALTLSSSAITGDSASTIDMGSGNALSLQTTNNGNIVIGSGNVGIGIASPLQPLHVESTSASSDSPFLLGNNSIEATSGVAMEFLLYSTLGGPGTGGSIEVVKNGAWTGSGASKTAYMAFYTRNNTIGERMRILHSGNVGIGTTTPNAKLDINSDSFILETAKTPASASATCTTGMIAWDTGFVYVCVATDTWKRSAISTW